MVGLIAPHGGVSQPIDRTVPDGQIAGMLRTLDELRPLTVSKADLATLYRIADGGLSPLTGPMTRAEWDRVLDEEVIVHNGKKYAWSIPLALPTADATIKAGHRLRLVDEAGQAVGLLDVTDVYPFDKAKYLKTVYGTERTDHPGAANGLGRPAKPIGRRRSADTAASEAPRVRRPDPDAAANTGVVPPRAASSASWLSRPATRCTVPTSTPWSPGLESLTRAGHFAGAVLNPLVGETKGDDVDAVTRMRTYRALIDNKVLGQGDTDDELWKNGRPQVRRPGNAAGPGHQDVLRRAERSGHARDLPAEFRLHGHRHRPQTRRRPVTTTAPTSGTAWPLSANSTS